MKILFLILSAGSLVFTICFIEIKEMPNVTKVFASTPKINSDKSLKPDMVKINSAAEEMFTYARNHQMDTVLFFIIDMAKPSGSKRFYVFNRTKDSILDAGLVAHGQGKELRFDPIFSNEIGSYCTSSGLYKIGNVYQGKFGLAYKLYGLEASNSNAYNRFVVLHAHDCVPIQEVYPQAICQSQGCPTVAPGFLGHLSKYIEKQPREILMKIME